MANPIKKKLGYHPHRPLSVKNRLEAHTFLAERAVCIHCGRKGKQTHNGHATFVRRLPSGESDVIDAINAMCVCTGNTSLYFKSYAEEAIKTTFMFVSAASKANGKFSLASGSRVSPGVLMPEEFTDQKRTALDDNFHQCTCKSNVFPNKEEWRGIYAFIDTENVNIHEIIKKVVENKSVFYCPTCEEIRCFQCCIFYKHFSIEDLPNQEKSAFLFYPLCPACSTPLEI